MPTKDLTDRKYTAPVFSLPADSTGVEGKRPASRGRRSVPLRRVLSVRGRSAWPLSRIQIVLGLSHHVLAEAHEDGSHLGAGGVVLRSQVGGVGTVHKAGAKRPFHGL